MPIILRRIMIVLSTTLLTVQVFFMPISTVYAETTSSQQAEKEIVTDVVDKDSLDSKGQSLEGGNFLEIDSDDYMETLSSAEDFESSTSSDEAVNIENDSSDYLVESGRENLIFTIDEDNIKQVAANTSFEIKVSTNQEINRFRLILPASAKFSIAHSYSTKVQELSDRSIIWLIETETVSRNFSIQLEFSESGQFAIEDENGEINADILYVETGEISTRNARININVGTWALFIAVWNNQAYTQMNLLNEITSTGTGNLNRPSGDLLITNNYVSSGVAITGRNVPLTWRNGTISLHSIFLNDFQIVGADLVITNNSRVSTPAGVTWSLTGTLTATGFGQENLYNNGYLTVENLIVNNGWITTNFPIRVNNTTSLQNQFYIRSGDRASPALETRSLVKSTSNGFAVWDLGSPNNPNSNAEPASRFWRTLTFTLQNNTIVNSSQETFNDETFQLSNSNKISSAYQGTPAVPEEEKEGVVNVVYESENGEILDTDMVTGEIGSEYRIEPKEFEGYRLIEEPENASGIFSEEEITVTFVYAEVLDDSSVPPVDPLDPEVEVDPENKPDLPENQGLLSIDYVSQYNFGTQAISAHDQTYYAMPQRLLNEDGTVNETEERPNYVQISDRRSENERNGWQLAVTQKEQFKDQEENELEGARLNLSNQQLVTVQGGQSPSLQAVNPLTLVPGNKRTLIRAEGTEGTGTWIYRFGDSETAGESVTLNVPKGTNPEATTYSTTLVWELSAVPDN